MALIFGLAIPMALFLYFGFATAMNPVSLPLDMVPTYDLENVGEVSGGNSYLDFYGAWVSRVTIAVGFGCPATYREFSYPFSS